ncbi:hypothetical protein F5984_10015 [Rudanella paleaurantiibacter]|uniref:Uncharacterized protein n=1 Tax=Rudanella paleaurantiibacter TaxID=2614655 RepID=A0A7J5U0H6_9BACT|nr:hypothetical protein [Rudanella paleaurantiibacter]KAB7731137.1 hypothetical protein F5984_10015 [Rudanella paleaurantiibacter]
MDPFDDLKKIWQQPVSPPDTVGWEQLRQTNATHSQKLAQTQLWSGIGLALTAVFLATFNELTGIRFTQQTTYVGLYLMALITGGQAVVNLYLYRRLKQIDLAAPVAEHLATWERYYAFRKQLIRINGPVYFLLLNGAFGLYFIEILGRMPLLGRTIALIVYTGWMLYAYFVLGKRTLRREDKRLTEIIGGLRRYQNQLSGE